MNLLNGDCIRMVLFMYEDSGSTLNHAHLDVGTFNEFCTYYVI